MNRKNRIKTGMILTMGLLMFAPITTFAQTTDTSEGMSDSVAAEVSTSSAVVEVATDSAVVEVTTDSAVTTSGEAVDVVVTGTAIEVEQAYKEGLNFIDGAWYDYEYDENGVLVMQKGLCTIKGEHYYFGNSGKAVTNKLVLIHKVPYYFNSKGRALKNQLKKVKKAVYYFGSNGKAVKNRFQKANGSTYYLGPDYKAVGGWVTVKSACYYLDQNSFKLKKNTFCDGYKLDKNGTSKTRYQILKIINQQTNSSMSKKQKLKVLFQWLTNNSYTYTRTYEHALSGWKWYQGWTDDFAYQLMNNHSGNCFRYAALYGYLVKEATGYQVKVYHGSTPSSRGGNVPHGWTTVNIGGVEYAFDPDMYKFGSKKSVYYFTPYQVTKQSVHFDGVATKLY